MTAKALADRFCPFATGPRCGWRWCKARNKLQTARVQLRMVIKWLQYVINRSRYMYHIAISEIRKWMIRFLLGLNGRLVGKPHHVHRDRANQNDPPSIAVLTQKNDLSVKSFPWAAIWSDATNPAANERGSGSRQMTPMTRAGQPRTSYLRSAKRRHLAGEQRIEAGDKHYKFHRENHDAPNQVFTASCHQATSKSCPEQRALPGRTFEQAPHSVNQSQSCNVAILSVAHDLGNSQRDPVIGGAFWRRQQRLSLLAPLVPACAGVLLQLRRSRAGVRGVRALGWLIYRQGPHAVRLTRKPSPSRAVRVEHEFWVSGSDVPQLAWPAVKSGSCLTPET